LIRGDLHDGKEGFDVRRAGCEAIAISMNSERGWDSTLGDCVRLKGTCERLTNVI
jgi:hypothetical protein